jgi:acetylglutamate kinase
MRVLIKMGGTLLDEQEQRENLARQIASLGKDHTLVVVHGGGKQLTRFLDERGITSRFVNGLRVSDERVIDAASKVIAGSVNKLLVGSLCGAGQRAVGLSGVDGGLTVAEQMDPDLEFVGTPVRSNGLLLELLADAGYLPVVACLAADESGQIYNVNADQMAVSCAVAFRASKLLFLTDVAGVRDGNGAVLSHISSAEANRLIREGVAHGGMQAKLEAASLALERGIEEVIIAPGHEPDICSRLLTGAPIGTRLVGVPAETRGVAR